MKKLIIILFLFLGVVNAQTVYHFAQSGDDDTGDGSLETPYKTMAKLATLSPAAGDSVVFLSGDTWRETLEMPTSGTSGSYIKYGRYGTGDNPRILGSETTTWADQGGNIWKSETTFTDPRSISPYYADIHFEETDGSVSWGSYKANAGACVAEYDWTWTSNYIYIYSATDPDSRYTSVEIPQRSYCVSTNDKEYILFNAIDVFYSADTGIDTNNDHGDNIDINGFTLDSCDIGYIGGIVGNQFGFGVSLVYSDLIIRNCTIHDCGRRGVSLDIYGSGFTASNAIVEKNTFYGGFHTTSLDLSVGSGSYTGSWNGVYFRNNIISDTSIVPYTIQSNQVFLQNYDYAGGGATARNIYIYNNIFKYPNGTSINMEGVDSIYVYNNTFYSGSVLSSYTIQLWIDANNTHIKAKNNLFYGGGADLYGWPVYCVTAFANIEMDYNLYYRSNAGWRIIKYNSSTYYMTSQASLISNYGWETNGVFADPLLTSTTDYHVQDGSPAKEAGTPLAIVVTDYYGNVRDETNPTIGAVENPPIPPTLVTDITVTSAGDATTIEVDDGTLQLSWYADPSDATDTTVVWSRINGTGTGLISATGLVTAVSDGTMTAKATANDGSGVYDDLILTFSNQTGITTPTVSASLTSWTSVSAIVAGNVTSAGGGTVSTRGICYSTSTAPDTGDNVVPSASGTGVYSCTLQLASSTTYYIRAYATNEEGTSYSSQLMFTTKVASAITHGGKVIKRGTKAIIVN